MGDEFFDDRDDGDDDEGSAGDFRIVCPNCGWVGTGDQAAEEGDDEHLICPKCGENLDGYE